MEPKVKRVKFNLDTETILIHSDDEERENEAHSQDSEAQSHSEIPKTNTPAATTTNANTASSQKIILRRNSVDCEDEIAIVGSINTYNSVSVIEITDDEEESERGSAETAKDFDRRLKSIEDENKWIEKYKRSCQQYSFINPLPHGKREETFPCHFKLEGCSYASDNIRTAVHVHSCDYRPVICTASEECGQIPFTMFIDHIRDVHEATGMVSDRRWWYHEQFILGDTPAGNMRLPIYFRQYDGQTFLLNTQIYQSKAYWWMTLHGELEKIRNYSISVRVVPRLDRKSEDDFLRSSDLDVYLSRQVVVNDIPTSNFGVDWDELCDYSYVKPKDEINATYWRIKVTIKRRKPKSNLALFTMGKEMKVGRKLNAC